MQKTVPDHSPLIAANVACHTCGSILKPQIIKSRRGVECIRYECHNKETGCSYRTEVNTMLTAECTAVRPSEVIV